MKAFTGRNQCTSVHLIQSVWWISVQPLEYKDGNDNLEFLLKHVSKKKAGSIVSIVIKETKYEKLTQNSHMENAWTVTEFS